MSATAVAPARPEHEPILKETEPEEVSIVDVENDGKKKLEYTKTFNFTWCNPETGVIHTGTFTARRPTIGMLGQIAVMKAQMNGGMVVDRETDHYHDIVSALHYILVAPTPEWWTPIDFFSPKPVTEMWRHVRSWLETFRRGVG